MCRRSYSTAPLSSRGALVESLAGYRANLGVMRAVSLRTGVPFWNFFKAVQVGDVDSDPTEAQLRWQVLLCTLYMYMAYLYVEFVCKYLCTHYRSSRHSRTARKECCTSATTTTRAAEAECCTSAPLPAWVGGRGRAVMCLAKVGRRFCPIIGSDPSLLFRY